MDEILQRTRGLLFVRRGRALRLHQLQECYCPHCGLASSWIIKRCNDRFCKTCRAREYQALRRKQQSIAVPPSHFLHLIFPMPSIPLQRIRPADIETLQNAVNKIRHQNWFKQVVLAGFYFLEFDINRQLEIRLHIHMVVETAVSARREPINIEEADNAWRKLVGQTIQGPFSLKRYTMEDANNLFAYVTKQLCGAQKIKFVRKLDEYITRQSAHVEMNTSGQDEYETRKLRRNLHRAENLRAYIVYVLNYVLAGKRRCAFFGAWRGVKPVEQAKRPRRCSCGSYAPPVSHTAA